MIAQCRTELWAIAVVVLFAGAPVFAGQECAQLCDAEYYASASASDVQHLIDAGADVNARDPAGRSPLHWVAGASPAVISELLESGADVTARDQYDRTPLHFVSTTGSVANIKLLLKAGADVNARTANDWTPIHGAAKFGIPESVELLLVAGADPSAETAMGETAYKMAQTNQRLAGTDVLETLSQWP